jgi:uncharacterized protein (TIGR02300 family)
MGPGKRHPAGTEAKTGAGGGRTGPANAIDTGIPTRQVKHLNFRPAQGTRTVAKPELGTKRLCSNCGAKFYDLSKNPIVCPKCHTVLELAAAPPRSRPDAAAARAPAPAPEEEVVAPEVADAEFVSLEEADAEAQGKKPGEAEAAEGAEEEEVELEDEGIDDATFIEEQEEGDEDVTDIIGDVEDEEES